MFKPFLTRACLLARSSTRWRWRPWRTCSSRRPARSGSSSDAAGRPRDVAAAAAAPAASAAGATSGRPRHRTPNMYSTCLHLIHTRPLVCWIYACAPHAAMPGDAGLRKRQACAVMVLKCFLLCYVAARPRSRSRRSWRRSASSSRRQRPWHQLAVQQQSCLAPRSGSCSLARGCPHRWRTLPRWRHLRQRSGWRRSRSDAHTELLHYPIDIAVRTLGSEPKRWSKGCAVTNLCANGAAERVRQCGTA